MPGPNFPDKPLTTAELDILEDAVEVLTDGGDWEWAEDVGPNVRERYVAYRQILAAYQGIALEEVPPGLLNPVLQQLNQLPPTQQPWFTTVWARLRRSQLTLPTLTVVATAGLVLWMAEPSVSLPELVFAVAPEPVPMARENLQVQPTLPRAQPEATKPGATATSPIQPQSQAVEPKASKISRAGRRATKKSTSAANPEESSVEVEDVMAPTTATDKDLLRSELERADGLRRQGACTQAAAIYRELSPGAAGTQRARALAGLSLCAEFDGQLAGAKQYMQQARAITAIDAWAAREREAMGGSKIQTAKTDN